MQNAVHKMDTSNRFGGNDTSTSSHGSFPYRSSNGPHNESVRVNNPNVSYHGANFNPPSDNKYGCEANGDNGNVESPYAGWQNINSANNNWNGVPSSETKPVGRSIHGGGGNSTGAKDDNNMMVDNDSSTFSGLIGATGGSDNFQQEDNKSGSNFGGNMQMRLLGATGGSDNFQEDKSGSNFNRPPQMPRMGLLGGGESSIMPPSANWSGSQGPTSTSSTWVNRQGGSSEMGDSIAGTPTKPNASPSWAQAAGKGLSPGAPVPEGGPPNPEPQPTQREKEAQEMRMRAATAQGWGPQAVNQDTPWEVDENPTEGGKDPMWRPPINNGTEIWENTLRISKGNVGQPQPPVATTVAPPWGHTPATNIGGHWGEDESTPSTWGGGNGGPGSTNWNEPGGNGGGSMWGGSSMSGSVCGDKQQWSGNRTSWNETNNPDPSQWSSRNPPPQQMANWSSPAATPKKEMGGGWEPPSPPPVRRAPGSGGGGGNYDDGTSAWGNPGRQGKVSHWKDMPSAKPIMNANGGMMMGGMPPGGPGMIRLPGQGGKPGDWSKPPPSRGTNWQDMPPHRDSPTIGSWNEDNGQMKAMGGPGQYNWSNDQNNPSMWAKPKTGANWADGQVDTSSWLGPAKQGWSEEMSDKNNPINDSRKDWNEQQQFVGRKLKGGKPLCKDIVHASKQFRILTEYGFRKEDVENALRNNNMNLDEAAAELNQNAMNSAGMDVDGFGGRKVRPANVYDEMSDHNMDTFNPNNFHGPNNFQNSLNFSQFKQQPPKTPGGMQQQLSPALIQKLLQQQQQQSLQMLNLNNVQPIGNHKFTTNAQLRHLVQQIQMAVQAGHLNAQILNQPLAPTTLQLLYQLLQQIKALSSLHQLQQVQQTNSGAHLGKGPNPLQTNVQIAQAKGRIANLQNQICAQQALFLKQQQLPPQPQQPIQPHHGGVPPTSDIFKPDTMPGLHSDFRDLTLKDMSHHHSRLNQWKLNSLDKDDANDMGHPNSNADFSRAPGPINSKSASGQGGSMHPLLEQGGDVGTWSGLGSGDSGWPDRSTSDVGNGSTISSTTEVGKEGSTATSGTSSYLTDLVPEFEPGKPWKGTQMKNIEDDPHVTPGSIARSPLSVNSIKDSNLFWPSKSSPPNSSGDGSSNTWGFNPQGGNGSSSKPGKTSWSPDFTTESWGSLPSAKSRNNAPPGLPTSTQGWDRQYNTTFLILKNLTPQIDGSTLKTLCMQHGPLQMFHLFLNRGVALVRYSSPEEARKAQSALDNCVLSNTTMLADIPSESEIQQYLQVSSGQAGGNNGSSNGNGAANNSWPANNGTGFYSSSGGGNNAGSVSTGTANWNSNVPATSQLWSFSNSSLWGSAQPSNEHDGSTNPISYLPNDLLGGEPI